MKILWRLLSRLRPHTGLVAVALSLVALTTAAGLVGPLLIRWAIDTALPAGRADWLWWAGAGLVLASAVRGVFQFSQRYLMEMAAQRAVYRLRNDLYQHIQSLSFSFFDRARTGQLMSRLTADVEMVRQFYGQAIVSITFQSLTVLGISIVLVRLDWLLALVSLAIMPFLVHGVVMFSRRVRPTFWQVQQQLGQLTSTLQENITGMRLVQAYGREPFEIERFQRENDAYRRINVTSARLMAFWGNYLNFLTALGLALVLWAGGLAVMNGRLAIGTLIAFNSYLLMIVQPVRLFGFLISIAVRATASAERLFELLDTAPDVRDAPDAVELRQVRGEVRFEGVRLAYGDGPPVLDDIDLVARPGERVAIVGPTGSGKTSLVHLIPRFYDVTGGRVLLDGTDVRQVRLASLRRHVGVVLQDTFLFNASIAENIAYGRPEASLLEIERAARVAQLHDFIVSLPQGYDTPVGERGVTLSGGQKQRLAIARAILVNAPVLILDESTSSVDAETEARIHRAMDEAMAGRTSFVIAQRYSTVRGADQIVVLDGGHVVERGRHEELLARGGLYAEIYRLQFAGAPEADDGDGVERPPTRVAREVGG